MVALYDSVNCLFIHRDIGLWEFSSLVCLALCQGIAVLIGWAGNAPPPLKNLRNFLEEFEYLSQLSVVVNIACPLDRT